MLRSLALMSTLLLLAACTAGPSGLGGASDANLLEGYESFAFDPEKSTVVRDENFPNFDYEETEAYIKEVIAEEFASRNISQAPPEDADLLAGFELTGLRDTYQMSDDLAGRYSGRGAKGIDIDVVGATLGFWVTDRASGESLMSGLSTKYMAEAPGEAGAAEIRRVVSTVFRDGTLDDTNY